MGKAFLVTAAVVLGSSSALASPRHWDNHDAVESASFFSSAENLTFDNYAYFSLNQLSTLTVDLGNRNGRFNTAFAVKVYQDVNGVGRMNNGKQNLLGTLMFNGRRLADSSSESFLSSLGPGNYYYRIHGTTSAANVPHGFTITSTVTPVPEPETFALALAGFGVAAFFGVRRRHKPA